MKQNMIFGILAMATVVVASNILVQFLLGSWLTWGAFTYPVAFLVTDVMNRAYGTGPARRVVLVGFVVGVICSLVGSQILIEVAPDVLVPAVALRVAVASAVAFLVAQMLDVSIFDKLRGGAWWRAPLASTLVGSVLDTVLFFSIAFAQTITVFGPEADGAVSWAWDAVPLLGQGPMAPLWVSLAMADWAVKLSVALIALIPFRILVRRLTSQSM